MKIIDSDECTGEFLSAEIRLKLTEYRDNRRQADSLCQNQIRVIAVVSEEREE